MSKRTWSLLSSVMARSWKSVSFCTILSEGYAKRTGSGEVTVTVHVAFLLPAPSEYVSTAVPGLPA